MARFWRRKKIDETEYTEPDNIEVSEPDISEVTLEPATERIAYRRLWKVGLAAAVLAAVANLFVFTSAIAAGIALVVPAGAGESGEMVQMPVTSVLITSALSAIGATLLLAFFGIPFFRGRLPRPTRILWGTAFFIWLFSLVGPLSLPVGDNAKAVMVLMHTIAAVVIVGVLTLFGREK
jgi:magnesium-transporting ATPase (P-type)